MSSRDLERKAKDPSTTSAAYDLMVPKWSMISTLLEGTAAMREAGEAFLPRHEHESVHNYRERLHSTVLFNMLELTLDSLVGRPFANPIQLKDDVPEEMRRFAEDVDLQGNNLTVFAREWFRQSLAKTVAYVQIEFPSLDPEQRSSRTLADDLQEGRRPYWILHRPEDVIFFHSEIVNGVEVPTHVRIREVVTELQGFVEIFRERIRVLEPGTFRVFEKRQVGKSKRVEWVEIESGETDIDFIPIVPFYTDRKGPGFGKPPLEDLAHMNIRHWQSESDQINILTVARFPILAVAGATDQSGNVMAIGPRQLLGTRDANGRFYYVEHTGKAIGAGRQELIDLEERMSSYGAEFLRRKGGNQTATARALDSAESVSTLKDAVTRFTDAVEQAMRMTAVWMGLDEGGSVELPDIGSTINAEALKTLLEARKEGDLSREAFLAELRRMGVLNHEFDPRADLLALRQEVAVNGIDPEMVPTEDFRRDQQEEDDESQ